MKKIITMLLAAASIFSFAACSDEENKKTDSTETQTTAKEEVKPQSIKADDINAFIDGVKEEYAKSSEMTLSDGTVISTVAKDPALTKEAVEDGSATVEQMVALMNYYANIRRIVCDRLVSFFPEENTFTLIEKDDTTIPVYFLDPVADGLSSAAAAFEKTGKEGAVVTDYMVIESNCVILYSKETNKSDLFFPSTAENDLLTAAMQKLSVTEPTE